MAVFRFDVQLDFSGLLHWQVGGLVALENSTGIDAGEAICLRKVRSVTHQATGHGELAIQVDRWHGVTNRQRGELCSVAGEECAGANHEPTGSQLDQLGETPSKSSSLLAFRTWSSSPRARAAACTPS